MVFNKYKKKSEYFKLMFDDDDQFNNDLSNIDINTDLFKRSIISKKHLSLQNLVNVLRPAFKHLNQIKNRRIVICYGPTGCGKSTLLNSLIFGPDALQTSKKEIPS